MGDFQRVMDEMKNFFRQHDTSHSVSCEDKISFDKHQNIAPYEEVLKMIDRAPNNKWLNAPNSQLQN